MEWEQAQSRFEELGTDEDEDFEVAYAGTAPFRDQRSNFTGYEGHSGRGARGIYENEEYELYDEEDDDYDDPSPTTEMQLALRHKEEELVDEALRRIRRARIRGDSNVDLSREEIDALERRQLIPRPPEPVRSQGQSPSSSPSKNSKPRKRGGVGLFGFGQTQQRPRSARSTERRLANPAEPLGIPSPEYAYQTGSVPAGYLPAPARRSNSSPSKRTSRPGSRSASAQSARQAIEPPPPSFPVRPTSSSSRGSPARSLPDDPDWVPRPRAGPSPDPFMYQTSGGPQQMYGRRIISGPPAVSYSSLRRAPPPVSGPVARTGSGSGLSQEIIHTSSEEGRTEDDEDEESDEGVTLDLARIDGHPGSHTPRGRLPPPPPPPAGQQRMRRSRR